MKKNKLWEVKQDGLYIKGQKVTGLRKYITIDYYYSSRLGFKGQYLTGKELLRLITETNFDFKIKRGGFDYTFYIIRSALKGAKDQFHI